MAQHGALSIIVNIKPGMKQQLIDKFLEMEAAGVENNSTVPFKKIGSIHFARFVVLHECLDTDGKPIPDRLAFTTNYDLPLNNHLNELVKVAGKGLWDIFSKCQNFPDGIYSEEKLLEYIQLNRVKEKTFYVGVGKRSVQRIHRENELRESIQDFLDQHCMSFKDKDPLFIRNKIIEFVNTSPGLEWAKNPEPKPSFATQFVFYGKLVLAILLLILLSPLVIPFLIIWFLIMLVHEIRDGAGVNPYNKDHIRELITRESGIVQTQFSAVGNVKPGWFRKTTMIFLLRLTDFLAPYLFSKGKLSGIPTVHFARWLIINDDRQMLFLSNFDGNSEGYLRDFIHIAAKQLTLLFSHTVGYPKTRFMLFGGATDARGFMRWARHKQTVTNIWYSAYKNISLKNIYNNSRIREGLYGNMSEREACKWLSKF